MYSEEQGLVSAGKPQCSPSGSSMTQNRVVVCAAVEYPDGVMLVGPRHFDGVMQAQYLQLKIKFDEQSSIKGFLDQNGYFMTREDAYVVAVAAGQITKRPGTELEKLFSEDLY